MRVRLQRQDLFVERARLRLLTEVLPQIREVQQRGNVVGIESQRRLQLTLGRIVPAQVVGIDDATIQMYFLGLRDAAIQCLLVGGERRVEAPEPPLQPREVVPGVRQIGPAREQAQVDGLSLGETPGLLQRFRAAQQGLRIAYVVDHMRIRFWRTTSSRTRLSHCMVPASTAAMSLSSYTCMRWCGSAM